MFTARSRKAFLALQFNMNGICMNRWGKHWVLSSREIQGEILEILSSKRALHELINKLLGNDNYNIQLYLVWYKYILEKQIDIRWGNITLI